MTYAGIGSRRTPQDILENMTKIATWLESLGYTLNSGGAKGADEYFEKGVKTNKNIFIPWNGFNGIYDGIVHKPNSEIGQKATDIVYQVHPNPSRLSQGAMKLQARNSYQILGEDLNTPVKFVICWTPCGMEMESERKPISGGTAQAISLANRHNIPVINMETDYWKDKLKFVLKQIHSLS